MTDKTNDKGFTLVETVVVGVLISVLAFGVYTLFIMYTNAARETSAHLKLQRQGDILVDEIAMRVRNGAFVLSTIETVESYRANFEDKNEYHVPKMTTADTLVSAFKILADSAGTSSMTFSIKDTTLDVGSKKIPVGMMLVDGKRFPTNDAPIYVDTRPSSGTPTPFGLWYGRKQIRVNIRLVTFTGNSDEFFLNIHKGAFRCRN